MLPQEAVIFRLPGGADFAWKSSPTITTDNLNATFMSKVWINYYLCRPCD